MDEEGGDDGQKWDQSENEYQSDGENASRYEKGMNCPICDKFLARSYVARNHLRMAHGIEENLYCPHCEVGVRRTMELAIHLLSNHPDKGSTNKRPLYTCTYTGLTFKNKNNLSPHIAHEIRYINKANGHEVYPEKLTNWS